MVFVLHSFFFFIFHYSEPYQISKIKLFTKLGNGFHLFTGFAKNLILVVCQGSEYASVVYKNVLVFC